MMGMLGCMIANEWGFEFVSEGVLWGIVVVVLLSVCGL